MFDGGLGLLGSIWRRKSPTLTIWPSLTPSSMIFPVMSELMSTFVCGSTCPLAVTDAASGSRRSTGSILTSTDFLAPLA